MNHEAVLIAAIAALGPTVAAFAAWRQAKGTRAEVATNHGKRAGEYLEMMSEVLATLHILKIETRTASARTSRKLEKVYQEHGALLADLDERVTTIEDVVAPPDQERGRIAQ